MRIKALPNRKEIKLHTTCYLGKRTLTVRAEILGRLAKDHALFAEFKVNF